MRLPVFGFADLTQTQTLQRLAVRYEPYVVASAYTFADTDEIDSLLVDATTADITITLPESPTGNRRRRVMKSDSSTNRVIVSGNSNLIGPASSVALIAQYDYVEVEPNGTGWVVIGRSSVYGFLPAEVFGDLASDFAGTVQDAIDYLSASAPYGGVVFIPRGSWSQTADIEIKRGVTLRGAGRDATILVQTSGAQITVGGQASTTYRAGFSDLQITAENASTTPAVVFDRCQECFAQDFLIASVDDYAIEIGTSANPTLASVLRFERGRISLDAVDSVGFRFWGGGEVTLNQVEVSGVIGNNQTAFHLGNTGIFDGLNINYSQITGDCDFGLLCDGSANVANLRLTAVGVDRSVRGAVAMIPVSNSKIEDVILTGGYFAGTGSTSDADQDAVILLNAEAGTTITDVTITGAQIKDGRTHGIRILGAGTITDITIVGNRIKDCGRAATNTYAGVRVVNAVSRLVVVGNGISNESVNYNYGVEIDSPYGAVVPMVRDNSYSNCNSGGINANFLSLSVYATGTVYSLTNADALINFGTTDPIKVVDQAGTWKLTGQATVKYVGATFAANQTVTLHLRRTNNTAADITNATVTCPLEVVTVYTGHVGVLVIPPVTYTTANITDSIELYGSLSAAPSAGSVDVIEASLFFERLY